MAAKKKARAKAAARNRLTARSQAHNDRLLGVAEMVRTRAELTALLAEAAVAAERLGMQDHEDVMRALFFRDGAQVLGVVARVHMAKVRHPLYEVQQTKGGRKFFAEALRAVVGSADEQRAVDGRAAFNDDDRRFVVATLWPLWERLDCTEKRDAKKRARTPKEFAERLVKQLRDPSSPELLARHVATALCGDARHGGNLAQYAHRAVLTSPTR